MLYFLADAGVDDFAGGVEVPHIKIINSKSNNPTKQIFIYSSPNLSNNGKIFLIKIVSASDKNRILAAFYLEDNK